MFKRKKQSEGQTPTGRPPASPDEELSALLTRATPRRPLATVEPATPLATISSPTGDAARRPTAPSQAARGRAPDAANGTSPEGRKLVVGREICLKGEVTSCDFLVVEGRVELTHTDARQIQVAAGGSYVGTVDVDEADIAGRFEGEMTVRDRLTVRAGGRVEGRIRYKNIIVEAGGHIAGDVGAVAAPAEPTAVAATPRVAFMDSSGDRTRSASASAMPRLGEPVPLSPSGPTAPTPPSPSAAASPALPRRSEPTTPPAEPRSSGPGASPETT